jgi:hypothetical protein
MRTTTTEERDVLIRAQQILTDLEFRGAAANVAEALRLDQQELVFRAASTGIGSTGV